MKTINQQINPDLVKQVKKLTQYTQLLSQILPIECRNHVEVANIRNQNLMLITDSPVWTTKLRQLSPQLLDFIQKNNRDGGASQLIHHIQISTRYHTSTTHQASSSTEKKRPLPQISPETAGLLTQSASSINHLPLKKALLKIAGHCKHNQDAEE